MKLIIPLPLSHRPLGVRLYEDGINTSLNYHDEKYLFIYLFPFSHSLLSAWVYRKKARKGICLLRIFSNGYLLANL